MKTYIKTIFRMLRRQIGRFIAISAIIALGIGLMTGLGSVEPKLMKSLDEYYRRQEVPDIILKSSNATGFSEEQIAELAGLGQVEDIQGLFSYEQIIEGEIALTYFYPLSAMSTNKLQLVAGAMPSKVGEIVVERSTRGFKKYNLGDKIEIGGVEQEVVGIVRNPLLISKEPERANTLEGNLSAVVYFDSALVNPPIISDLYLEIKTEYLVFSNGYQKDIDSVISAIKSKFGADGCVVLTLNENYSGRSYKDYADKVNMISLIFSFFFIAVVALVVLSTMTRLVEEERSEVGCYKTLGYSNAHVILKFLSFAFLSCLIGSILGIAAISTLMVRLIYGAFSFSYSMPPPSNVISFLYGSMSVLGILLVVLLVTGLVTRSLTEVKPAQLLRAKSPRPGKKIMLERIPFIWKRLPFKYKSTCRNLFRYIRNFFLTSVSVAGSTSLVIAGFGLYDSSKLVTPGSLVTVSTSSMTSLAMVLIACAGLLDILVIYNLTNINIEERKREIATLKVLGYKNFEVAGYIYRETFILSLIGLALGLPLGYGFAFFIFNYVDFGSINDMQWYSWLLTVLLSLLFTVIVDLLLYRKIIKIDMNTSLKALE